MALKIFIAVYVIGWLSFIYGAVTAKYEDAGGRRRQATGAAFRLITEARAAKLASAFPTTPETVPLKKSA